MQLFLKLLFSPDHLMINTLWVVTLLLDGTSWDWWIPLYLAWLRIRTHPYCWAWYLWQFLWILPGSFTSLVYSIFSYIFYSIELCLLNPFTLLSTSPLSKLPLFIFPLLSAIQTLYFHLCLVSPHFSLLNLRSWAIKALPSCSPLDTGPFIEN